MDRTEKLYYFDACGIVGLLAGFRFASVLLKGDYITANRDALSSTSLSFCGGRVSGGGGGGHRKGDQKDISIQRSVAIKCVLYIYLIFITIIYGCINLTFTVLPLHIRNLTYLKMDYTVVKNPMAFEISVSQ